MDEVAGMGKVAAAKDLTRYVPLTGREPQLKEFGPAWVVTVHANMRQPASSELWIDPDLRGHSNRYLATSPPGPSSTCRPARGSRLGPAGPPGREHVRPLAASVAAASFQSSRGVAPMSPELGAVW